MIVRQTQPTVHGAMRVSSAYLTVTAEPLWRCVCAVPCGDVFASCALLSDGDRCQLCPVGVEVCLCRMSCALLSDGDHCALWCLCRVPGCLTVTAVPACGGVVVCVVFLMLSLSLCVSFVSCRAAV